MAAVSVPVPVPVSTSLASLVPVPASFPVSVPVSVPVMPFPVATRLLGGGEEGLQFCKRPAGNVLVFGGGRGRRWGAVGDGESGESLCLRIGALFRLIAAGFRRTRSPGFAGGQPLNEAIEAGNKRRLWRCRGGGQGGQRVNNNGHLG